MSSQYTTTLDQVPMLVIRQQNLMEYQRAHSRGQMAGAWARLTGQENHLRELRQVVQGKKIRSRRSLGVLTVRVDRIVGSESRSNDFDRSFRPLKTHTRQRWISVATAFSLGVGLPAVELIKIGEDYYVRDGHHRISVSRVLGYEYIEAYVTELVVV